MDPTFCNPTPYNSKVKGKVPPLFDTVDEKYPFFSQKGPQFSGPTTPSLSLGQHGCHPQAYTSTTPPIALGGTGPSDVSGKISCSQGGEAERCREGLCRGVCPVLAETDICPCYVSLRSLVRLCCTGELATSTLARPDANAAWLSTRRLERVKGLETDIDWIEKKYNIQAPKATDQVDC
eukprot:767986-Hanusia_phi.AAC.1